MKIELVGLMDPPAGFWRSRRNRSLARWAFSRFGGREANRLFITSEPARSLLPAGEKAVTWDEVKNLADCQHDEILEVLQYQADVTRILASEETKVAGHDAVSGAMSYGLTAPHSEGTPFYISGLLRLFDQEPVSQVLLLGPRDRWLDLLAEAAKSRGIPVLEQKPPLTRIFGAAARLHNKLGTLKRRATGIFRWLMAPRRPLPPPGSILVCVDKIRSIRLWAPILERLEKTNADNPVRVLCPNRLEGSFSPVISRSKPAFWWASIQSYLRYRRIWYAAEERLRSLPNMYRGVRIAPNHTDDMKEAWLGRAYVAAMVHRSLEEFFERAQPAVLCINEPLENSVLIARAASQREVPTLFHHPLYTGEAPMAAIWEASLGSLKSEFCAVNEWQARRFVEKGLGRPGHVHVVGDVLAGIIRKESSAISGIRERIGLDPAEKVICFLSRPVSTALSSAEKKWILRDLSEAARLLGGQLLVKGHPYEKREVLEAELADAGASGKVVITEISLGKALGIADVAVGTPESSSNLDAIYAGTPLIVAGNSERFARYDRVNDRYSYRYHKACIAVVDGQPLLPAVKLFLENESARDDWRRNAAAFAEKIFGSSERDAADLIAEKIQSLAHTKAGTQRD